MTSIALVSTYEGGMQPLTLATAAAHLRAHGHTVECYDDGISPPDIDALCGADIVAFSIPLYESVQRAADLLTEVCNCRPEALVIFYGPHAVLQRNALLALGASAVALGDWEDTLVHAAARVSAAMPLDGIPGLATPSSTASHVYHRTGHRVPDRSSLPPLNQYVYAEARKRIGPDVVMGNVETARGCRFSCTYCSIFASNHKKVTVFDADVIHQDIANVVEAGATHICFTDAEFFNAPANALEVVRRMHREFPDLTFDFTTRADLVAENPGRIEEVVSLGARFVTSAFEFPSERVLEAVNKQFSVATLERALAVTRAAGLQMNPTFLLFNPWTTFDDLGHFGDFVTRNGLDEQIEPVQFTTRLWLYKGSPLLQRPEVRASIVKENLFNYEWTHPEMEVEELFKVMSEEPSTTGALKRCCLKC
ncbi:MAG TPA: radical SAM protein [Steroidobacteraceae bacterium]